MARRIAVTLLLVAYLAGQWAAIPHAHADGGDAQHSGQGTQSHIHVSWFGDHAHEHGSSQHHHHGDESHSHQPAESSTDLANGSCDGHDSDAVYLPEELGQITVAAKIANSIDDSQYSALLVMAAAIARPGKVADFESARIAEECIPGCPLFLALRALRI